MKVSTITNLTLTQKEWDYIYKNKRSLWERLLRFEPCPGMNDILIGNISDKLLNEVRAALKNFKE